MKNKGLVHTFQLPSLGLYATVVISPAEIRINRLKDADKWCAFFREKLKQLEYLMDDNIRDHYEKQK